MGMKEMWVGVSDRQKRDDDLLSDPDTSHMGQYLTNRRVLIR